MSRSIPQLITAAFAGDPITPADAKRLQRHIHHMNHVDELLGTVSPEDAARAETTEMGDDFRSYRSIVLSNLRGYTIPELHHLIRTQLVMLGAFVELQAAKEGHTRRVRKQRSQAGSEGVAARRAASKAFLRTIAKIKARPPVVSSDVDAARRYLKDKDADWSASTDAQRARKVSAVTRRIRRAQKEIGRKRR